MSRSRHGQRAIGLEYWKSRLHPCGEVPGKFTKRQTARKERRADKKLEREER